MLMRLVHLWSARAKRAVLMRLPSYPLPQRVASFADGPTLGYRSGPTPWPRWAVCALLKTRNQLIERPRDAMQYFNHTGSWGRTIRRSVPSWAQGGDASTPVGAAARGAASSSRD